MALRRNNHASGVGRPGIGPCGSNAAEPRVNSTGAGCSGPSDVFFQRRWVRLILFLSLIVSLFTATRPGICAPVGGRKLLAATPPMGWNDWAHYQCGYTAQTILNNAKALVTTGLAARGYDTVTIDDCWMSKDRDAQGNLKADPRRFPHGMEPVAKAVHALGLKFGIYEDAGSETCGGFAGSGQPQGGGKDHFLQDAKLFASWGVDYLKLDGCNVYVPKSSSEEAAYREAYAAEYSALKSVDRPIVFSESAPAYFMDSPQWYDVLGWVRDYGQLWREGTDMANYDAKKPGRPRFKSVLWNYSYNLPLGRFQKPGNWDDADFIIGGDGGMSAAETRSQLALWAMMSAPLILSSDVARLGPQAIAILSNRAVIAVDQDPLGRMATLIRRTPTLDILLKRLAGGDDAVAALNRSESPARVDLHPADLGFGANSACRVDAENLWNGKQLPGTAVLEADLAPHDTAIWRIHPGSSCGAAAPTGAIIMTATASHDNAENYFRCLAAPDSVGPCTGGHAQEWTVTMDGALRSSDGRCLAVVDGKPAKESCRPSQAQNWRYTLEGNLISAADRKCLSAAGPDMKSQSLEIQPCGHNLPNQIWTLPN
jgi:alpha-galactosidase